MTTNNNLAMIQSYIYKYYTTDDVLSIAQRVYEYMLKESIEFSNDNICSHAIFLLSYS